MQKSYNCKFAVVICWFQNKCTRYLLSSYISQCDSGILQWWLGHCWRSDGFWRRWIVDCGLGFWGWGGCCPLFCCNSCFLKYPNSPSLLTNKFKKIVLLIHLWTQKYVNDNERKSISDKSTAYSGFPFAFSLFPLFPGSLQSLIFLPFLPLSFPLCLFFPSLLFPFPLLCLLFPPLLFFPLLPLFLFSSFPFHFSCLPWWSHWLGFLWEYRPTITLLYSMFWSKSIVLCVSHYRLNEFIQMH